VFKRFKINQSNNNYIYMKKTSLLLGLFIVLMLAAGRSDAQISISVHIGPPVIPVYTQPACPVDGYLWVPGYWAYGDDGYYWVPGYWSAPPQVGFLWTPGYWGYAGGVYGWHAGYWGPHIGFYGGVNYGFGYGGVGYVGGGWVGGHFQYNTAVTNVNTTVVHNTYINRTVVNNVTVNRVSYNGGPGGVQAQPNAQERIAMNEHHVAATSMQMQHEQTARADRNAYANVNHGRPATTAVARPMTSVNHGANGGHVGGAANGAHVGGGVHQTQVTRQTPQTRTVQSHPAPHPAPHGGGGGEGEHHHR
jgi:hypothetical protein